jgi:hypothetical protein
MKRLFLVVTATLLLSSATALAQSAPPLTVRESDRNPSVTFPTELVFPNGTLTRTGQRLTVNIAGAGTVTNTGALTLSRLLLGNDGTDLKASKITIVDPATGATLNIANNGSLITSGGHSLTLTTTGATNVTFPTTGTLSTLAGAEALTNKSYNGLTLSATTGTFTLTNAKTLTVSNTLTFTGTDGSSVAFGAGGTVPYLGTANVFTTSQAVQPATDVPSLVLRRNDGAQSSVILSIQEEDNDPLGNIDALGNLTIKNVTSTTQSFFITSAGDVFWKAGNGSPEGAVSGGIGSLWSRLDGGTDTSLYRKESGTGNTGWVAVAAGSAGGANTALSNLASVAINTTLVSDTDNTDDLGASTVRWKDIWISNRILAGTTGGTGVIEFYSDSGTGGIRIQKGNTLGSIPSGFLSAAGVRSGTFYLGSGDPPGGTVTENEATFKSTYVLSWTSGAYNNATDTGLARSALAVLKLQGPSSEGATISAVATTSSQITADQNNYNPGAKSFFQRWSTDASRNITGLTFTTAQVDGQIHTIINVGSADIVLKHQDTGSTAANRFICSTGADIPLTPNQAADVIYDNTRSRWLVFKRN